MVTENKYMGSGLENTIAVWATPSLRREITGILTDMDAEVYVCDSACDLIMIPSFIQIIDGLLMTDRDKDFPVLSCILTEYSGHMEQCGRCRHHQDCLTDTESRETEEYEKYDSGPEYTVPTIMLHAEARQRDIEGLLAILPPMKLREGLSDGLAYWLRKTISYWHRKALVWRIAYQEWNTLEEMRRLQQKEKKGMNRRAAEIAWKKWQPKSVSLELRSPDFT